ncbi:MAG: 50S ribosomal protein L18 [Candidatus Kerfeldbacteria bacterium]|nr:50S ribosomal protein L18 [Candidatus Kerfeldbacteria bacterium]
MPNRQRQKRTALLRRRVRSRAKLHGTAARPRLSVFRSLQHISAQLIDDAQGRTLLSVSDRELPKKKLTPTERARALGQMLGERAVKHGITAVIFDRGGRAYHGRVQAVAEGARTGGLQF